MEEWEFQRENGRKLGEVSENFVVLMKENEENKNERTKFKQN